MSEDDAPTDPVWTRIDEELTRRSDKRQLPASWAELARRLGTTEQRLNNWRRRRVPPASYGDIADIFGWTVDQVAGRDAIPRPTLVPLRDALHSLGSALAREMPDDIRQDAADLLGKLALRRGVSRHQDELAVLLESVGRLAVVPNQSGKEFALDQPLSHHPGQHVPAEPQELGGEAARPQHAPGEREQGKTTWNKPRTISNAPRTDFQQDHQPGHGQKSSKSSSKGRK